MKNLINTVICKPIFKSKKPKKLLITLQITNGIADLYTKDLIITKAEDIHFAALRYAASYFMGELTHIKDTWIIDNSIAITVHRVKKLSNKEFKILNKTI